MTTTLSISLRIAGAMLLLLAVMHGPISRRLNWCEESMLLSPVNAAVFRVHALVICLILVALGWPCLAEPGVFLERTRAGAWLAWTFAGFWTARLYVQWFVFPRSLEGPCGRATSVYLSTPMLGEWPARTNGTAKNRLVNAKRRM